MFAESFVIKFVNNERTGIEIGCRLFVEFAKDTWECIRITRAKVVDLE
jgi:hypothetical protein